MRVDSVARGPPKRHLGVDEAGRGPVLGPLVVAAVACDDPEVPRRLGARDSKILSPWRRAEVAAAIAMELSVAVRVISAADLDAQRVRMTLNDIEVTAFQEVILELLAGGEQARVRCVLDAADVDAARFGARVGAGLPTGVTIISKHKADETDPVVAAASVMAKTRRDAEMVAIAEQVGTPVGSGYPSDPTTIAYLEGLIGSGEELPPFVRRSWKTVARIRDRLATRTLDQFG